MAAPHAIILGLDGLRLTEAERAFFAEADPWGFILFARNIADPAQVSALTPLRAGGIAVMGLGVALTQMAAR